MESQSKWYQYTYLSDKMSKYSLFFIFFQLPVQNWSLYATEFELFLTFIFCFLSYCLDPFFRSSIRDALMTGNPLDTLFVRSVTSLDGWFRAEWSVTVCFQLHHECLKSLICHLFQFFRYHETLLNRQLIFDSSPHSFCFLLFLQGGIQNNKQLLLAFLLAILKTFEPSNLSCRFCKVSWFSCQIPTRTHFPQITKFHSAQVCISSFIQEFTTPLFHDVT